MADFRPDIARQSMPCMAYVAVASLPATICSHDPVLHRHVPCHDAAFGTRCRAGDIGSLSLISL